MVRSGIRLFKFWFSVSREEQLRRFLGRARDPLKRWKPSPMDVESLGRWNSYTKAKEAMFFYTDTADAPWTVVRSDDKNRARLHAMRHVLNAVPYAGKDPDAVKPPDPWLSVQPSRSTSTAKPGTMHAPLRAVECGLPGSKGLRNYAQHLTSSALLVRPGDFSL
jgi:hypothetical protein